MELMLSSPLGPVQQMLNAVPSSPEQVGEQVAQFRYAERQLPAWSFFLRVRAESPVPHGPAWPGSCAVTSLASCRLRSGQARTRPWRSGRVVQSASVVRPHARGFSAWSWTWAHRSDSRHARAFLRCCAAPAARDSSHPLASPKSWSSRPTVHLCCPILRKCVPRPDSVSSAQSYPRVVARDRASASVGLKLWPAHNPAAALPATGAVCCCCHRPHRQLPSYRGRRLSTPARSCVAPTLAWWRTPSLPALLRHGDARHRRPILLEDTTRDQPTPHPCYWRSKEIRQPGCSRCAPPCQCTGA